MSAATPPTTSATAAASPSSTTCRRPSRTASPVRSSAASRSRACTNSNRASFSRPTSAASTSTTTAALSTTARRWLTPTRRQLRRALQRGRPLRGHHRRGAGVFDRLRHQHGRAHQPFGRALPHRPEGADGAGGAQHPARATREPPRPEPQQRVPAAVHGRGHALRDARRLLQRPQHSDLWAGHGDPTFNDSRFKEGGIAVGNVTGGRIGQMQLRFVF